MGSEMCIRDRSGGGAIYSNGSNYNLSNTGNYLIIDRCVFRENVSRGESGALGGAIDLMSSARITNSLFDVINRGFTWVFHLGKG